MKCRAYKFMTCNWENLAFLNYKVNPEILENLLPEDLELDLLHGKAVISIVCFEFSNAKLLGIKIPFHQYFPEINVRTYVKSKHDKNLKGIYFLSEMVPKLMTYLVGKFIYGEPFSYRNVEILKNNGYEYMVDDATCKMKIYLEKRNFVGEPILSEEQNFVIDRFYAFCGKVGKKSKLYEVKHPKWNLQETIYNQFKINKIKNIPYKIEKIITNNSPSSIFSTNGSHVEVNRIFFD